MVIDDTGKPLGELALSAALDFAREKGLDLVEVAPKASPPVCKILDFGAYAYAQEKAYQKQRAHQKRVEIKGIRISFQMGEHDRGVREQQSRKFLTEGHKVKLEMILRGRQNAHKGRAAEIMKGFAETLTDVGAVESPLSHQGNRLFLLLTAKKHG
jgi:translation initiation factor IF-3